jgi:hypothetical protein
MMLMTMRISIRLKPRQALEAPRYNGEPAVRLAGIVEGKGFNRFLVSKFIRRLEFQTFARWAISPEIPAPIMHKSTVRVCNWTGFIADTMKPLKLLLFK